MAGTNMSSFDSIIANPPYGKSSSLSKKIVNALLENKVAKEMVVLAPPKSFADSLPYLKEHVKVGRTGEYFDIIAANGVDISLGYFTSTIQNKYKDLYKLITPKKEMQLYEALLRYNEGREGFWEKEIGNLRNFTEDDTYLFAIPFFTPEQAHAYRLRKGICYEHNFEGKKWPVTDAITHNGFIIKKNYKTNFTNWWYSYLKDNNTLLREIANMIYYIASASPSLKVYLKFLPHLDWSRPWTDQEILAELNLPEDFLEKEQYVI